MSQENVEIVKEIYADWQRGDFSSVGWADPEVEFTIPGPDPDVHRGVEAMGRAWAEWLNAFRDFRIEAQGFHDAGDEVVVEQVFHGEGKGSGISLDQISGAAVFSPRDGGVIRFTGYTTVAAALAAAGIGGGT